MIPARASAAAWSALPDAPLPVAKEEDEEHAELSISDQRTLYLVNIFIGNTARFLNSFASLCQDKLAQVHSFGIKIAVESHVDKIAKQEDIEVRRKSYTSRSTIAEHQSHLRARQ